jgi:phosphate/sulfate permease
MIKSNKAYILLAAVVSIPIFWAAEYYTEMFNFREYEAVATAITIAFFGIIYLGRKIAISSNGRLPIPVSSQYIILGCIVGINFLFLLIYPNFNTLHHMPGINLLLYWMPFFLGVLALGMLIKLVRMNEQALKEANKVVSHSQSELKLLQSQISPHYA